MWFGSSSSASRRKKTRSNSLSGRKITASRRRKPQGPGILKRFLCAVGRVPGAIKRGIIQFFVAVSLLTATFPTSMGQMTDWVRSQLKGYIDPDQFQSLLDVPLVGELLQRGPAAAAGIAGAAHLRHSIKPAASSQKQASMISTVKNPLR